MPKYFCDYCDTYLTHDSPSVRKTHNGGRKHKDQVRFYYERWLQEQTGLKVLPGMMPYQMPNQGKPLMPTPLMPPQGVPMRFTTPPGGFGIPPGMPGFPGGPPGGPPGGMMPPRFPPPGVPPPMMPQQNITNMQPPSSS